MSSVIVIGGGHNGLVLAIRLAQRGCLVTVLEQRANVGGAAETLKTSCGCTFSRAANAVRLIDKSVLDLIGATDALTDFFVVPHKQSLLRTRDGDLLVENLPLSLLAGRLASQTGEPEKNFRHYFEDLNRATTRVANLWTDPFATRQRFREQLRLAGQEYPQLFLDGSLAQTAAHYFENELAALALCDLCHLMARPITEPGSAFSLLYLSSGNAPFAPGYALPKGGMGRLSSLLRDTALAAGVRIVANSRVISLKTSDRRVTSARLANGSEWTGDYFVSAIGPATTEQLLDQTPAADLKLNAYETGGAKLSCIVASQTLDSEFGPTDGWPGQITLIGSRTTLHTALLHAAHGDVSDSPLIEITLPITEKSGSCADHRPISIYSLFFPHHWCSTFGQRTNAEIERRVRCALRQWYPLTAESLQVVDVLSPLACEGIYGMWRGDVDHGSFASSNVIDGRGYARLPHGSTPFINFFNCSAGIHPGGLISGRPGLVCANTVANAVDHGEAL